MKDTRKLAIVNDTLSRRQVLRGLGACITLPTLLSASPAFARAVAKKAAPTRMAFVYAPNGMIPAAWWPAGDGGADFALSPTLAPLAKVRADAEKIPGGSPASDRGAVAHCPRPAPTGRMEQLRRICARHVLRHCDCL